MIKQLSQNWNLTTANEAIKTKLMNKQSSLPAFALTLLAFTLALPFFSASSRSFGADISLTLNIESRDDIAYVSITNTGSDPAFDLELSQELDSAINGPQYVTKLLLPGETIKVTTKLKLPQVPGSYPLITVVSYLN